MGSTISSIADEIKLHGSWEAYLAWRHRDRSECSGKCAVQNEATSAKGPVTTLVSEKNKPS